MSHQTGIKANEKLRKFFGQCRDGKIRAFKISIENEELTVVDQKKAGKNWETDFDKIVPSMVKENQPCYIFYRLDSKNSNSNGYNWLFISWSPDTAPTREKMLYASTKSTLKQDFGTSDIEDEFHATILEEVSLAGYKDHKKDLQAPVPLTFREEEMKALKITEWQHATEVAVDTKHQTMATVAFPIEQNAKNALSDLRSKKVDYVQLKIDLQEERIQLVEACKLKISDLKNHIPKDSARYHILNFKHKFEGDSVESIVFIYSMPGYVCSVKERMLYSSCKAFLIESLQSFNLEVEKKIEIDADDEVDENYLLEAVHPKVNLHRPKFEKPPGPPNRGARRLTKPQK